MTAGNNSIDLDFSPVERLKPVIFFPNFGPFDYLSASLGKLFSKPSIARLG
jgi:hypothetical protein